MLYKENPNIDQMEETYFTDFVFGWINLAYVLCLQSKSLRSFFQ